MKKYLALSVGVVAALLSAAPVSAFTNIPNLPSWDTRDETIGLGNYFAETWQVSGNASRVAVTDLYVVGDNYNIYKNGTLVASTNVASYVGNPFGGSFTTDPNVAWSNPLFAHAYFAAKAGDLITIQAISLPSGFGDSTVAISQTVPEPATWAMMLIGFAGLGFAGYRRAKAVPAS